MNVVQEGESFLKILFTLAPGGTYSINILIQIRRIYFFIILIINKKCGKYSVTKCI